MCECVYWRRGGGASCLRVKFKPRLPRLTTPRALLTPTPSPPQRSNKRRTLWYALLEVLVMSAVGCWNVYFVQSLFKGRGGPPRPRMMV